VLIEPVSVDQGSSGMSDLTFQLGSAPLARKYLDEICNLYDQVFSKPPFRWIDGESESHRRHLSEMLENPSFGISIAESGDSLVGFAYGIRLGANTGWWHGFPDELGEEFAQEYQGPTFALIDLALHAHHRGRGFGRELLETLLTSRKESWATLSVQPTATETQEFYRHLGWRYLGRKIAPQEGSVSPNWDVYIIRLASE
jgi:ribosomal protein S18 acetylase RimI-like enzyme